MYSYTIIQWLFFFYVYCFMGWCVESTYVSIHSGKLTNRGFIRGPFLPLYGSGAIVMLFVAMPFKDKLWLVYLAGCVGATALEYMTGVVMEALFKVRYWDYSEMKFHFQGRICLGSSIAWGFCTVFLTRFLHVLVEKMVFAIPSQVLTVMTILMTVLIGADFALSFKAAIDIRNLLAKMKSTKEELVHIRKRLDAIMTSAGESLGNRKDAIVESVDEIKSGIEDRFEHFKNLARTKPSEYLESVKEEVLELVKKYTVDVEIRSRLSSIRNFFQRDLIRSNPSMTSDQYQDCLEELKQNASGKKEDYKENRDE